MKPWRLTGCYGFLERSHRRDSWDLLYCFSTSSQLPWCVVGDFNDILSVEGKKGGNQHPHNLISGFQDVVQWCDLINMRVIGHPFTWEKGRGNDKWIEEKLDRIMVTKLWWDLFSITRTWNLEASYSDHSPLFLDFCTPTRVYKHKRFQFENVWLREAH